MSKINHEGGLALLWKKDVGITVVTSLPNHINALVNKEKEDGLRFMGFYEAPETFNHIYLGAYLEACSIDILFCGYVREILMKL